MDARVEPSLSNRFGSRSGPAVACDAIGAARAAFSAVDDVAGLAAPVAVSFGSSDFGYASLEAGDALAVRFPPSRAGEADGLRAEDAGVQYAVGGSLMTVKAVENDVVTFATPRGGSNASARVSATNFDGFGRARADGLVEVRTPGFRPAWYLTGSGTTTLVFRYVARRGDAADDLDYTSTVSLARRKPTARGPPRVSQKLSTARRIELAPLWFLWTGSHLKAPRRSPTLRERV